MSIRLRPTKSGFEIFGFESDDIPEGIWVVFGHKDVDLIYSKSANAVLKILNIPSWLSDVLDDVAPFIPGLEVLTIADKLRDRYVNLVNANKKSKGKGVKICFHFQKCGGLNFGPVRIRK